jgi:hypothetical protein
MKLRGNVPRPGLPLHGMNSRCSAFLAPLVMQVGPMKACSSGQLDGSCSGDGGRRDPWIACYWLLPDQFAGTIKAAIALNDRISPPVGVWACMLSKFPHAGAKVFNREVHP